MKLVDEKELAELQDFKIQALKGKALAPQLERIAPGFRGAATEYLMRRVNADGSNAREVVEAFLTETPSVATGYKEPVKQSETRSAGRFDTLATAIADHLKKTMA